MGRDRGSSHSFIPIPRPMIDGLRLVRRSDGLHLARATTTLSKEVCALCLYGPAKVRGLGKHTARYAADVIASELGRIRRRGG